tara:strand:+ start:415 stop:525 length:111 start_codon:yes stop_codon:yes gene_type:complete
MSEENWHQSFQEDFLFARGMKIKTVFGIGVQIKHEV